MLKKIIRYPLFIGLFLMAVLFSAGILNGEPSDISSLRTQIKEKYGIATVDGTGGAKWTSAQLQVVMETLKTLPSGFIKPTESIQRDKEYKTALGFVRRGTPTVHLLDLSLTSIKVNDSSWRGIETPVQTFQGTLVHEMTHTFQDAHPDLEKQWATTFWEDGKPKSRSPSAYGNSMAIEDMAESIRAYWQRGEWMKTNFPDRYEFVKTYVMEGKEFQQIEANPDKDPISIEKKKKEIETLQSKIAETEKEMEKVKLVSEGKGSFWVRLRYLFMTGYAKKQYEQLTKNRDELVQKLNNLLFLEKLKSGASEGQSAGAISEGIFKAAGVKQIGSGSFKVPGEIQNRDNSSSDTLAPKIDREKTSEY